MQIEKVTISFARKKNLGDYESADASCMLTAFLDPGDDRDVSLRALWTMAKQNVMAGLAGYFTDITIEDLFLGLPAGTQESEEMRPIRELIITLKKEE